MEPIIITQALPFDSMIAGDIAITAAEGGVNYWASAVEPQLYDWKRWTDDDTFGNIEVPDDFLFYVLDWEGRQPDEELIRVTPLFIRLGVERFLNGVDGRGARRFADIEDLAAMDADEADTVIQLAAFGEVVFG